MTVLRLARPQFRFLTLLTLLSFFALIGCVSAATLTVTNVNDSGAGSLRAAVAVATSGDMITFDTTIFSASSPQVITLTSGQLSIGPGLTIQGPGANVLTISGNNASRVFSVSAGTVSISGLTIANGTVVGYYGGGIYNGTAALTLTSCNLVNNTAINGNGAIGVCAGLYNAQGSVNLTNCSITGNSAQGSCGGLLNGGTMSLTGCSLTANSGASAGAISNNGTLTLTNCSLSSNAATNGSGGAISYNGSVALTQCILNHNTATGDGGAVCGNNVGHTLTLAACNFTGNSAGGDGGAIKSDSYYGNLTLTNCAIIANSANGSGGGIKNGGYNGGILTLTNCTFTANTAVSGGGIKDGGYGQDTLTATNCLFYTDSATTSGNEILSSGTPAVSYSDIGDPTYAGANDNINAVPNFVSGSSPFDLHLQSGSPCLGAGTASGAPTMTLDGRNRPSPPSIGAYEAALTGASTTTTLTSSLNPSVSGQYVVLTVIVTGSGGTPTGTVTFTIDGAPQAPVTLHNGHYGSFLTSALTVGSHSITATYSGDANFASSVSSLLTQTVNPHISPLYVSPAGSDSNPGTQAAPKLTIQAAINSTLSGDTVIVEDGAYTGPGNMDLDFGGNNLLVTSQHGPASTIIDCGGIANHRGFYLHWGETRAVISGFTIQNGNDSSGGAGVYNSNAALTIQNCVFKNNTATYADGGGLYNSGTLAMTGCTLTGNSASSGVGGGISNESGTLTVINCAITGNSAGGGGGGVYNGTAYNSASGVGLLTLSNCVITGNTTAQYGGGLYNSAYYGANTVTNCTFTGNSAGNSGGGLLIYIGGGGGSTFTLTNDIVYGDSGGEVSTSYNTAIKYCDIQGGYGGTGNINVDPLFYNSPTDLHLQSGSPCLGAGTPNGAPATTIDGRLRSNPPSMGAYEIALTGATSTTTTLTSSLNPSLFGQNVTFTAAVTGTGGTPTGTVTFSVDGTPQAHILLSNGTAAYTASSISGGSHLITAAYSGDSAFAPGKSPALTQTVTTGPTTTTLTSSLNPSTFGWTVSFTATVTGSSPTGTVTFTDTTSGATLGTGTVSNGTAGSATSSLTGGMHQIVAAYGGDVNNSASASAPLTQTVSTISTTTTLTSNVNPSLSSQTVTFTATVAAANGGRPTGTVTFTVDGIAQPPVTLNYGDYAAYSTSSLTIGSHTVTAAYNSDGNFAGSASPALTQTVNPHLSPQYVSPAGSDSNPGTQAAPRLTIQAAMSATLSGDTVIVEDGIYTGSGDVDLDFGGQNITVTSQHGAASAVINCQGSSSANHRGFYLHSGETSAVISGLTIENGYEGGSGSAGYGGGIYNFEGGLTVQNCILKNNAASGGSGGGFYNYTEGSSPIILTNCLLTGNAANYGGGLYAATNIGMIALTNCTLTGNAASYGSGVYNYNFGYPPSNSTIVLTNDILYGDVGVETGYAGTNVAVNNCDIQGGYAGTGNLNADPLFVSAPGNLHLQAGSPCIGAGTSSGAPAADLDGKTRPNPPSMGAYDFFLIASQTALAPSLNPSVFGQSVTFTATVTGSTPTGMVSFYDGSTLLGTGTLAGGTATFSTSALTVGMHTLTAAYGGDAANSGSSSGTLTQTVSLPGTSVSVAAVSGAAGQTVTLSATLASGSVGVSGKTLTFQIDGAAVGTGVTTGSGGTATCSYLLPSSLTVGSHTVTAAFAGDSSYTASSGTGTLTVTPVKANTTLTLVSASGAPGQTVTLTARLRQTVSGTQLSGESIAFSVDGAVVGTAVTGSTGLANLSYAIPNGTTTGSHSLTAAFAGDSANNPGSVAGTLTVTASKAGTTLTLVNAAGAPGQTVTLTARLRQTVSGTLLSGETLTFSVDGMIVGAAVTNSSGLANLSSVIPVGAAAGAHALTVTFAGDTANTPGSGAGTLTVTATKANTTLTLVNATATRGQTVTLTARLRQTVSGTQLGGETLSFSVDGTTVGMAVTGSTGLANLSYAIPIGTTTGAHTLTASFAGDSANNPGSVTGTVTVN